MIETIDIKKALYRENPKAELQDVRKDGIVYKATVYVSKGVVNGRAVDALFTIPLQEVGEVIWERQMDAKLLIRWLQ